MLNLNKNCIGIHSVTWTNDDLPELGEEIPFEQCVSEMALAGFRCTEIGGKFPKNINLLKKELELRKLSIVSQWFSSYILSKNLEEVITDFKRHIKTLSQLGAGLIGVSEQTDSIHCNLKKSIFKDKPIYSEDDWEKLCFGLNILGEIAAKNNIKLVYHHHMGTGIQNEYEIDKLMNCTDPNLVYLLYDTGHLFFSGADPLYVLKKHIGRIKHVHLKDIRDNILKEAKEHDYSFLEAIRKGIFTVPGDGIIDFFTIIKTLFDNNYKGPLLVEAEQDPQKANPLEYAIKARKYIKEISGL